MSSLSILDINPLSDKCFAKIFSHSIDHLSILLFFLKNHSGEDANKYAEENKNHP